MPHPTLAQVATAATVASALAWAAYVGHLATIDAPIGAGQMAALVTLTATTILAATAATAALVWAQLATLRAQTETLVREVRAVSAELESYGDARERMGAALGAAASRTRLYSVD